MGEPVHPHALEVRRIFAKRTRRISNLEFTYFALPALKMTSKNNALTSITVKGILVLMKKMSSSFLNEAPELLLLRLLARKEMYGYQIVEEIRTRSGAALSFGEGCIYPCLHYLEAEKLVSSRRKQVDGRNRNYYKLSDRGRKRLEALTTEWNRVTAGVALLVEGQYA